MSQLTHCRTKSNSLSDAREYYGPGTASCSGATHVPSEPFAAILDCRMIHGILWVVQETFSERLLAPGGRTSTLFNNSKKLAFSSQELRLDIQGNTKRPESEMRR